MQTPRTAARMLLVTLLAGAPLAASQVGAWRPPPGGAGSVEVLALERPASLGHDACGCVRELRICLVAASVSLGRCLAGATYPAREVLCYLKFDLDVVLCLERVATCQLTCSP